MRTEALNELAILRDRFGSGIARAAIVTAEPTRAVTRHRAEELGIDVKLTGPAAVTMAFEGGFDDFFLSHWNGELSDLTLQAEEVMDARWATREEMRQLLAEKKMAPFWPSFLELLFDLNQHMGLSE